MASLYALIKPVYRRHVPKKIRDLMRNRKYPLHIIFFKTKKALQSRARHDEIYDEDYFRRDVEPSICRSAAVMARSMVERFHPETVIDIGCGTGALLAAFENAGVRGRGYEYADAGIAIARSRGMDVRKFDLESDEKIADRADLVVSTEVAEHLPEAFADMFVRRLAECGNRVVITAAVPGQGGEDHVNEQPNSYWITKFSQIGLEYEEKETADLRKCWKNEGVEFFYAENVMVFVQKLAL